MTLRVRWLLFVAGLTALVVVQVAVLGLSLWGTLIITACAAIVGFVVGRWPRPFSTARR